MSGESERCPVCDTPVSAWMVGNCPTCLMGLGSPGQSDEGQVTRAQKPGRTIVIPAVPEPPGEKPGDQIGPYKLLERLGEAGMGTVWQARQSEPVRREVALKVISRQPHLC